MAKQKTTKIKNSGKIFESCIQKSVPDYALIYRLPDSAQVFGGSNKLRFSRKNPFDYILWDSKRFRLFALELKTKSGHSISFERDKDESGDIHYHQIEGLREWNRYEGIVCGFIIEFRDLETTFFLSIESFDELIQKVDKKSFNLDDLRNNGIEYIEISQTKLRTNYSYDLETFLEKV
jgi:recombination protein U